MLGTTPGISRRNSSITFTWRSSIVAASTDATGLDCVKFGLEIREPVITTSSTICSSYAKTLGAKLADPAAIAAIAANAILKADALRFNLNIDFAPK